MPDIRKYSIPGAAAFILFVALVMFREVIFTNDILFTTDDNIGALAVIKRSLPYSFIGNWQDGQLSGNAGYSLPLSWTPLLIWLLPLEWAMNGMHAFYLAIASLFLFLFLRRCGLMSSAALIAVLTAFWLGSNLTLTYAGHTPKFAILMLASITLYALDRLADDRVPFSPWALLAGGSAGFMLLEQQDVGIFFGLLLAAYGIFRLLRVGMGLRNMLGNYLILTAVTLFIALPHALRVHAATTGSQLEEPEPRDPEEHWDFVTQWSWPPEESLAFIAPGYTGWRTGDPQGPYWGRMGASPDWARTGRGMRNFKLEDTYIGSIPLLLALLSLAFLGVAAPHRRAEILFWFVLAVIAYLLALGKFFPLYGLLYRLPLIQDIRNPNKMLMVMQLAWAIVAAYGIQGLLDAGRNLPVAGSENGDPLRRAVLLARLAGVFIFIAMAMLVLLEGVTRSATINYFIQQAWSPAAAETIVALRFRSLVHAAVMALAGALFVSSVMSQRIDSRYRRLLPWLIVFILLADAMHLAQHYIKTLPRHMIDTNPVVEVLREELDHDRAYLYPHDHRFYGEWISYLFPYQNLAAVNIQQMPRMPPEYRRFLEHLQQQHFRQWQLMGVSLVLMPSAVADDLLDHYVEEVMTFNVTLKDDDTRQFIPAGEEGSGAHGIYRLVSPGSRFVLLGGWRLLEDENAVLRELADPRQPVMQDVRISSDPGWPRLERRGRYGAVDVIERKPYRFELHVSSTMPYILRVAEKYDPGWSAWVNNEEVKVVRADYLFQAIYLPAGENHVVFEFRRPVWPLYTQAGGWIILGIAVLMLIRRRKPRTRSADPPP